MSAAGAALLSTSPQELRRAARLLRTLGEELDGVGARALVTGDLADGWTGLAALEHQARVGALHRLVVLAATPGREVAQALDRCAAVAEDAGARARAGLRRAEQGLAELASLRAVGPPPEPVLEQAWRRRLVEVEQEVARARSAVSQAEEAFNLAQQEAAGVLGEAWSVVEEAPLLRDLVGDLRRAATGLPKHVAHLVRTTDMVIWLARARWAAQAQAREAALHRATLRLQQLWLQLRSPREARRRFGRTPLVPGPVGWVSAWLTAWSDARHGGGYDGWRGGLTRVLARGALVGGPMALAGLHPALAPAAPVGLGLISLYQTWMLGNEVWDGLPTVARYARTAVRRAPFPVEVGRAVVGRARDRATARLRQLRAAAAGSALLAGERVRDVVEEVLDRSTGTVHLRDRMHQVGVPIRLPAVPLGPVLRAPVDLGRWPPMGGVR